MGGACSIDGEMINTYEIVVRKPERKKLRLILKIDLKRIRM
jgi:hypothetical protein